MTGSIFTQFIIEFKNLLDDLNMIFVTEILFIVWQACIKYSGYKPGYYEKITHEILQRHNIINIVSIWIWGCQINSMLWNSIFLLFSVSRLMLFRLTLILITCSVQGIMRYKDLCWYKLTFLLRLHSINIVTFFDPVSWV